MLNIISSDLLLYGREKIVFFVHLVKRCSVPKTVRVSKLRANETKNEEHEEENSIDKVDGYFVSGDRHE